MSTFRTLVVCRKNLSGRPGPRLLAALCVLVAIVAAPGSALAWSLAREQFVYPVLPLPGLNLGSGWGAPWVGSAAMITMPPTLQYPLALPPAGSAVVNTAEGEAFRPFAPPLTNLGNDLWVSFMEETLAAAGSADVALFSGNPNFPTIIVYKTIAAQIVWNGGVAGTSNGPNIVDFFIIHFTRWNGVQTTVELYLNPTSTPLAPTSTFTVTAPCVISEFYWRSSAQQALDEIRAGTTAPDVAGVSLAGDMNCDGQVNFDDINPFVLALSDPAGYQQQFPNCNILNGDINGDGVVNFDDINPFVALLSG